MIEVKNYDETSQLIQYDDSLSDTRTVMIHECPILILVPVICLTCHTLVCYVRWN